MADFGEEQLRRISFHLLTFQNPRARQHVLRNRVKIADFFRLQPRELEASGLFPEEVKAVRERDWAAAEREIARLERNGIGIVFRGEPDYPPLLDRIYDPPDLIYVKGDRRLLTREPTTARRRSTASCPTAAGPAWSSSRAWPTASTPWPTAWPCARTAAPSA